MRGIASSHLSAQHALFTAVTQRTAEARREHDARPDSCQINFANRTICYDSASTIATTSSFERIFLFLFLIAVPNHISQLEALLLVFLLQQVGSQRTSADLRVSAVNRACRAERVVAEFALPPGTTAHLSSLGVRLMTSWLMTSKDAP